GSRAQPAGGGVRRHRGRHDGEDDRRGHRRGAGAPGMTETHSRTGVGRPGKWWEITMYRTARAGIWGAAKLFGGITITGTENIPEEGSFILAPVHRSNVDFALVALVTKRRMRYIAKDSLFKVAWLSKIWIALGSFPVVRGTADRESL